VLFSCATPIGNLEDMSFRLISVMKQADAVACEDTRRSAKLYQHIKCAVPPLLRLDSMTEKACSAKVLELLRKDKTVLLFSDAGTPVVSDPGAYLISRCHQENHAVSPIPGPSAVTSLLSVAGFHCERVIFGGFFPRVEKAALAFFEDYGHEKHIFVFFESPKRILKTLDFLAKFFPNDTLCLAKELSKVHERLYHGRTQEIFEQFQKEAQLGQVIKGEWAFALECVASPEIIKISSFISQMKDIELSKKQIMAVGKVFGLRKNQLYSELLE